MQYSLDGGELFFVRTSTEEILYAAHEKDLKGRHQRRSAGAVKDFGQIVFREIEFEDTEITQVRRDEMIEDGVAEALAEEGLVAHKHVGRAHFARLEFADEALGLGESAHQNSSVAAEGIDFECSIQCAVRIVTHLDRRVSLDRRADGGCLYIFTAYSEIVRLRGNPS